MEKALVEAGKELLRVVLLALIPVLVTSFEAGQFDLKVLGTVAAIAFLRSLDKLLHEWGKEEADKVLEGGLTRF